MALAAAACLVVLLLSIALLYGRFMTRIPSRLHPHQAPKAKLGLVPVGSNESPARAGGIDIIFVHGLGSNPDTTWRAKRRPATADSPEETAVHSQGFVDWVSEFLPEDLYTADRNDVRMFYYNYDSYWKRDAVHTRLATLGDELLEHIREIRRSEPERSRDLVFVGYSYGGLVVKQALVQAQASRDLSYVGEQTKAVLFLGTPHRGSSFSTWGWLAAQALWPLDSNPTILANLEYDSTSLLDLHRAFTGATRDSWRVYNFFEQRPTQIFRLWFVRWQQLCVREPSATYEGPNVRNIGVPVDHSGLNKFGSRSDSYRAILSKLIEATASLAALRKHYYAVPLGRVHTYTERSELSTEMEEKLQIRLEKADVPYAVALHGLGGAGKSQLALDYAETHKDQYNPILWIDATDEEAARFSFRRCAAELGLSEERAGNQGSVLTDTVVHAVLRWLRGRAEADGRWLVVIDNADDVSWGLQKIMPKGEAGSILITSRDEQSTRLVPGGCEQVRVGAMSPAEASALLLRHLRMDSQPAAEDMRRRCEELAGKLGHLALAVELAGAYIGNDATPAQALLQYIEDYDRHRDELLRMDNFRGLLPTQKTVWTVWQTTLDKITAEHADLQPGLLLTFLAQFRGTIVQDEMLRLVSLGMAAVDAEVGDQPDDGLPSGLRQFLPCDGGEWDSFRYRRARDILVRYSLLRRVEGEWPGVTMHSMVQWRATRDDAGRRWRWWYTMIIVAACCQTFKEHKPSFRRHLIMHLPGIGEDYGDGAKTLNQHECFVGAILGKVYYDEGLWKEAESLHVQVMGTRKKMLGEEHPLTLTSMSNLAATYRRQGRWKESELLEVQVIEIRKRVLGEEHPLTLTTMSNLALVIREQGLWKEAEELRVKQLEICSRVLGEEHPETLTSMTNLASLIQSQGRWKEAEELQAKELEICLRVLEEEHPLTLTSMANLASTFYKQGRWSEAESMEVQVIETRKRVLGEEHPDTLTSMANLALTFWKQGRWSEAESMGVQAMETRKRVLGEEHPDTLTSMNNLAFIWKSMGRHTDALRLIRASSRAQQRILGPNHQHIQFVLRTMNAWQTDTDNEN